MRRTILACLIALLAAPAWADQARAFYRCGLGQFDAVPACTQFLQSNPPKDKKVSALISRGEAYATAHDYQSAIADQNAALALDPKSIEAYADRGLLERELGNLDRSIADLSQALTLGAVGAEQMQILNARADAYAQRDQTDMAEADYKAALALAPNDETAKHGLAVIRNHRATKLAFEIGAGVIAIIAVAALIWAARTRLRPRTQP